MTIERHTATVWYAQTARRRYFSKSAAIRGEARARILKRYPNEKAEYEHGICTCSGYNISYDEPERYEKMHRRLVRLIKAAG